MINSTENSNQMNKPQIDRGRSAVACDTTTQATRRFVLQNFVLIWLGSNATDSDNDFCNSVDQLRQIVNTIDTFTDADDCVDFITEIKVEEIFMIVSNAQARQFVPLIHEKPQLHSIYVLYEHKPIYDQWTKEWSKVRGPFTEISSICHTLKQDTRQCDRDCISITVTTEDLNRLDPSFMYTQLLKETLLEIEYYDNGKTELVVFCREQYSNNSRILQIIDEFERDYRAATAIWWYTRDSFIYQMLNRALRLQEINTILKMGFFIKDLHKQIEQLYIQPTNKLTVYRGQGLSNADFENMRTKQKGLLSFNNFLSTSFDRQVSLLYAESCRENPALTGILFQISIDFTALTSTPFASVDNVSYFSDSEKEFLFSMHTVFRIGEIKPIEDRLWDVELILTTDNDEELNKLTAQLREEAAGLTGWHRLGSVLIQMGNLVKAEEVYEVLLEEAYMYDEKGLSYLYNQLGIVKYNKGDYIQALVSYQKALNIRQRSVPPNHPSFAITYNNIAAVYEDIGEYLKALDFYQKALEIDQKTLPLNRPGLAITYNNIGSVYDMMSNYSKALEFYQKALKIKQDALSPNHPSLAISYSSIGDVYDSMQEYSKALEFYHKAVEIFQKSLPPHHHSIGLVYNNMGDYAKALEFYEKSLENDQQTLSPDHPELTAIHQNIGELHYNMGEYSKALLFYERAVDLGQHSLSQTNPFLQLSQKRLVEIRTKL